MHRSFPRRFSLKNDLRKAREDSHCSSGNFRKASQYSSVSRSLMRFDTSLLQLTSGFLSSSLQSFEPWQRRWSTLSIFIFKIQLKPGLCNKQNKNWSSIRCSRNALSYLHILCSEKYVIEVSSCRFPPTYF